MNYFSKKLLNGSYLLLLLSFNNSFSFSFYLLIDYALFIGEIGGKIKLVGSTENFL